MVVENANGVEDLLEKQGLSREELFSLHHLGCRLIYAAWSRSLFLFLNMGTENKHNRDK